MHLSVLLVLSKDRQVTLVASSISLKQSVSNHGAPCKSRSDAMYNLYLILRISIVYPEAVHYLVLDAETELFCVFGRSPYQGSLPTTVPS